MSNAQDNIILLSRGNCVKIESPSAGVAGTGFIIKSLNDVDTAALRKVLTKTFKEASKLNVHTAS